MKPLEIKMCDKELPAYIQKDMQGEGFPNKDTTIKPIPEPKYFRTPDHDHHSHHVGSELDEYDNFSDLFH